MKKFIILSAALLGASVFGSSANAGVASIGKYGTSSTGEQVYKIKCSNGSSYRYWWHDGEWWGSYGVAGMRNLSIQQLAKKRCG